MKKISLFVLLLIVFLAGCTQSPPPAEKTLPEEKTGSEEQIPGEEKMDEEISGKEDAGKETLIRVGAPKAPPTLAILRMMEEKSLGENISIELDIWDEPSTLVAMVQGKEHDVFAFPLTVVSTLRNKGMDVKLMNVNTWGVTYFLTSDPDFKTWADLKGQTVYVPLQSSPPDALTQFFLGDAGLKVGEDVTLKYASMTEVAQLLISGEAKYATLIEPQVSKVLMQNDKNRVAFSFEEEWQRVTGTETMLPNAGVGAAGEFLERSPQLAEKFQQEYKKALDWVLEHPQEAGQLAEKHLGLKAQLIRKAIPTMGLHFKSAQDAREELSMFYQLLYDFEPKMIGGKIPDEDLYYEK